jgi:NTP pyrophosphatase (non-canonical NTP hydrolase)
MTLDEYQAEAKRTAPRAMDAYPGEVQQAHGMLSAVHMPALASDLLRTHDVLIWALGLAGEAGEVADLLKKVHGHGKPLDREQVKKELGDVLWYVANLADAHGFTLSEVAVTNVTKLRARYPRGFTVAAAAAKADEGGFGWSQGCDARTGPCGCGATHLSPVPLSGFDANGSPVDAVLPCPICDCAPCQCEALGYRPGFD